jgi:penicillin-insensitive murein DD-endopeptidase
MQAMSEAVVVRSRWRIWSRRLVIGATLMLASVFALLHPRSAGDDSICIGTPANGSLRNAVSLPHHGDHFSTYSTLGWLLGRQHLHGAVQATVVDAMQDLAQRDPGVHTVFGESGWPWGGQLRPHRTHRNGTSLDVMVPVRRDRQVVPFPASPFNLFGYGIEFDAQGRYRDYRIDYDAMVAQLLTLQRAAQKNGIGIDVVIFDGALQQQLWKARDGRQLKQIVRFSKTPVWIRHDEHYHVNFRVACARS